VTALARFRILRRSDLKPIARAWISLASIEFALRFRSFHRVLDEVEGVAPTATVVQPFEFGRARAYARWIDVAARHHVVRARCLHRSLVLHKWLRSEGLPSALRIGVRKKADGISAHAWVEMGGEILNDRPDRVAPFAALSGAVAGDSARSRPPIGTAQWL
jgi:hypothetical protein